MGKPKEPVLIIRASDPDAIALIHGMVDHRRRELLGRKTRGGEVEDALSRLSRMEDISEEMREWNMIYGGGNGRAKTI